MCGIFAFFNTGFGIKLPKEVLNKVAKEAQKRGQDGFGLMLNDYMNRKPKSSKIDFGNVSKKSYGLLNCRAKPETECETTEKDIQPIFYVDQYNEKHYLVHNGAISESYVKKIYEENNWTKTCDIDSEALVCMAYNEGVNEKSLSKVDGGFAFIHMIVKDGDLVKVNIACKYQPLYVLEVSDNISTSRYFHSLKSGIEILKEHFKNTTYFTKDYEFPAYSYISYDLLTDEIEEGTFEPTFQYPSRAKVENKIKVLCSCSGGIDSTTSLIMAHKLLSKTKQSFDIDMVHFQYGHRGDLAEKSAIRDIYDELHNKGIKVNLKIIDLEDIYKNVFNIKNSQLINERAKVSTGTQDQLKSTIAWVPVRNMLFQTIMTGLAETYILEEGYKKVYMVAGWNQLSEEGFYPDNSTRFSNTMMEAAKYGTLVGHKIFTWNICSQLLKSDQWLLAKHLNFIDLFKYTISCDIPVKENNTFYNCNGQCGSTLLSMWASKRYIGIQDPRTFKEAPLNNVDDSCKRYELPDMEPIEMSKERVDDALKRIIKIPEITYSIEKAFLNEEN